MHQTCINHLFDVAPSKERRWVILRFAFPGIATLPLRAPQVPQWRLSLSDGGGTRFCLLNDMNSPKRALCLSGSCFLSIINFSDSLSASATLWMWLSFSVNIFAFWYRAFDFSAVILSKERRIDCRRPFFVVLTPAASAPSPPSPIRHDWALVSLVSRHTSCWLITSVWYFLDDVEFVSKLSWFFLIKIFVHRYNSLILPCTLKNTCSAAAWTSLGRREEILQCSWAPALPSAKLSV